MSEQNEKKEPIFHKVTFRVNNNIYDKVKKIADKKGESTSEILRQLVEDGLTLEIGNENKDILASIVREQLEIVLKPKIERLAKIGSKGGCMSATATFLNVQALMDLSPLERRKDVKQMYEKARKRG
ncbi:ribbon-helix-helix protein, CopG family [Clostridium tagluense]|uniref:ribbon-helix-helix protein, CopG family n=1 Tax=Clostridium tagluense TaxID=360422 RepID=UPI001C0AD497|nr:ribbon-helix-helix protein, CopG family [Clostridium tagluense]MBU3130685.1 ribbon-helix-helix protein, CopG family [Clostridium tagluense]